MRIVDIAVKRPVAVSMFTFAVLLFGMVSLGRLSVNLLPDLSYPTLTIRTDYDGAAPGEVEQLVSKPIEEAIGVVKGVRKVTSTSRAGQSDVVLSFAWGTDMDFASLEVREKLDVLQLPLDIEKPRLLRFNPSLDPVIKLGLTAQSDTSSLSVAQMKRLRLYAEQQVKRALESVEGVAAVRVGGGLENEIHILIDQQKASQLSIPITRIIDRVSAENINAAGGRIDNAAQAFLVRTLNQFETLSDIENLFIGRFEGKNIQLKDIATVESAYKDRDVVTRFNGNEGIEIAIYKEGDANAVNVAQKVASRLNEVNNNLPSNYTLSEVYDQSVFIKQAIDNVKSAAVMGGILAMLVLYLFLKDFWATVIISVSIPVSVIATFNLMYANDISLNMMSLGGIALAVGLLVDNSIVVLENIDRHKKLKMAGSDNATASEKTTVEATETEASAASEGTKEVSGAIVASTLTTMAVFVPLIFVEGIAGQLFKDQALTVSFALAASLVVALTLIPAMAHKKKKQQLDHEEVFTTPAPTPPTSMFGKVMYYITLPIRWVFRVIFVFLPAALVTLVIGAWHIVSKLLSVAFKPLIWVFNKAFDLLASAYEKLLRISLRAKALVLAIAFVLAAGAVLLIPRLGMELIPTLSQGEFSVEVTLPAGSPLARTDAIISELAAVAVNNNDGGETKVLRTYAMSGTGSLISAAPNQGGDHWGRLNIVMQPTATAGDMDDVKRALRDYLAFKPQVQATFSEPELFSFASPIQIEIAGYDLNQLQQYGDAIATKLASYSNFADVTTSIRDGNPELKIAFHHAKLARLELDASTVSQLIAAKVGGRVATQYSVEDRKVDVLVRTQENQRDDIASVRAIVVNPGSAQPIPLSAVADVYMSVGPSEITRVGQQRVALVSANLAKGKLDEAVAVANKVIAETQLPLSLSAEVTGQSEDMQSSFRSLQFALALAVFMVYLVMASQFESLLHPLLILFAVPLAGAGSVYGLWLTNTPLNVVVFIGLIMLCGIVVNNAIVLVDRINQLRRQGVEKDTAILDAAKTRLRPIVMTTLTTVLGLLPMAFGLGEGAEIRTPMAITVIYGLLFASLLTLILLPVLYSLFDVKKTAPVKDNSRENVGFGDKEAMPKGGVL
ncbi:AcrB/AcrD/AcrF family protein [Alteromonas macleodii str. 'Black Sea 11']|nr:AcrB/AcrD/AcrF family protein [Alteromonas macleodii str. 'Black Sea 11']NKX18342.1 efflux RND transporter permease subunit [Alteromonadaceae bacterium A_SAG5]NKX35401.1 efflux RND transporter permease subunit [Alteromonadaceae bacterium A_SAG3]NKX70179.1 efflux RND transporter permease subunit [Alteromonadaceae bacterium A_SAG7]